MCWCLRQNFLLAFSYIHVMKKGLQNAFLTIMIMKSTCVFTVLITTHKHVPRFFFFSGFREIILER